MTSSSAQLKPLIKWTGGKRRELPRVRPHLPDFTSGSGWTYVEPFVGGGALYFDLKHPRSVINDADEELVNFYRVAASQNPLFLAEVKRVADLFGKDKRTDEDRDRQAAAYYELRNLDREEGLLALPDWKRAARFFVVNQLAFSGMRRFNANGEFNVPFGHYKNLNADVLSSDAHIRLLTSTDIRLGGYEAVLADQDNPETFVFVDPPYTRVMKAYSAGATFGDAEQHALADRLKALRHASWMVVIDRSELTEQLYGDHVIDSYTLSYGVNIKNRFSQATEHIVATNYATRAAATPATSALASAS